MKVKLIPFAPDPSVVPQAQRWRAHWESVAVSLAMSIAVGAGVLGLWLTCQKATDQNFRERLIVLAQAAATTVNPTLHAKIRSPVQLNDTDYTLAVAPLRRIKAAVPDIHYIYTLVRDAANIRFVLDAADPGALNKLGGAEQSGVWEVYKPVSPAMLEALGNDRVAGIASATTLPVTDSWGVFMTGFAPIRDSSGHQIGAIGVDVDARVYMARLERNRNLALLGLLPAGAIITMLGFIFFRIRISGMADAHAAVTSAEAARYTAEMLAEERRRLGEVIEGTDVGTWEWCSSTRSLSINERWATIIGYRTKDLLPLTFARWRALVHPDDADAAHAAIRDSLESAEGILVHEFRMRHSSGYWVWILARGKATHSGAKEGVKSLAGIVMDVTARKMMEAELLEAAHRDKLTGLANRTLFMEHLERTVARVRDRVQPHFAVLFLDFDRFKLVNDTLGHDAGDDLLRQISGRLQSALRINSAPPTNFGDDLISRFGGDEFLILINKLHSPSEALLIAERLLNVLTPAYSIFEREVHSLASIGIITEEQGCADAAEVVRNADVAMYEAKRAGGGRSVLFRESMHTRLARHVMIETSLRGAIGTPELYLEYQPIVDLRTGRKVSVEALIRWSHPVMGAISPSEFIPIAEESGLIVAIGRWVLEEACRAMAQWRERDPGNAPHVVSVNLSRAEIALGDRLLRRIRNVLKDVGIPPQCLQLEVTEREVMRDPGAARELLSNVRALGVSLAMDDFGTGTSSLSLLRSFPFSTVKIDRSFLQDLSTSREVLAVIQATINLIENLDMTSIAEGVETAEQVAILQSLGCCYAQGYFFSRPVSAERLPQVMQAPAAASCDLLVAD